MRTPLLLIRKELSGWLPAISKVSWRSCSGGYHEPAPLPVSSFCLREGGGSENYTTSDSVRHHCHYIPTFRGNSLGWQALGKGKCASSFQAREDHHPSDGEMSPSVTAHPMLSSFHSSAGFLVDKDPHATGNLGTKSSLNTPWVSDLTSVFWYGGLETPQARRGQLKVGVLQD